jgi:cytosine/adenosine deaminase-related metal-dependent hydrolase
LRSSIAMAALVLIALAARWPAAQAERVLAITNVSVVDVVQGATQSDHTIEAGKIADLVLLDANPLLDIGNAKQIRAVITDGRLLNRAALDRMLAAAESSARDRTR